MRLKAVQSIPGTIRRGRESGYDSILTKFNNGRSGKSQVLYEGEQNEKRAASVYTSLISRRKALGLKEEVGVVKRGSDIFLVKR